MYCDFFGLRFRPFEERADTRFFCEMSDAEEALAAMEYEAHYGKGMALLLGEAGTGKTLLIRMLLQRLQAPDRVVVVTWPPIEAMDLLREVAKGFGVSLSSSQLQVRYVGRLRRHLIRLVRADKRPILIIDQAENLSSNHLAQVATLTEMQHDGRRLLSIILVGQPRFRTLLNRPEVARIRQQLYGERHLPALNPAETDQYIRHRLSVAGAVNNSLFDSEATSVIYKASGGIARLINHICDAALLSAYGAGLERIDQRTVSEVAAQSDGPQRSAQASDLGLTSTEQVATGWAAGRVPAAVTPPAGGPASPRPGSGTDGGTDNDETDRASISGPVVENEARGTRTVESAGTGTIEPLPSGTVETSRAPRIETTHPDPVEPAHTQPVDPSLNRVAEPAVRRTTEYAEALINRLERVVARAERMNGTTEASLAQHAAVERHLTSLTSDAERLVGELTGSTQRASNGMERVERGLRQALAESDVRLKTIEGQLHQAVSVAGNGEEQARRLEQGAAQAERIQAQLTDFAEDLADKAGEVQDRMSALMAGLEASESSQKRLEALLEQESTVSRRVAGQIDALNATTDGAKQQGDDLRALAGESQETMVAFKAKVEQFKKEAADHVLAYCRQKLDEQLEVHLDAPKVRMAERIEEYEKRLEHVIDAAESRFGQIKDALAVECEKADKNILSRQDSITRKVHAIIEGIEGEEKRIETLERRRQSVESTARSLTAELDGANERVRMLEETIQRAADHETNLDHQVSKGQELLRSVQDICGQMEATQHSVSTMLLDIGGATERLGSIRNEVQECERTIERLQAVRNTGAALLQRFDDVLGTAAKSFEDAEKGFALASEQNRMLESKSAATSELIERLENATQTGQALHEKMSEGTRHAQQVRETTQEHVVRLIAQRRRGEGVAHELKELIGTADQLQEAIQGAVAHADEKIGQLDAHDQTAARVLSDLAQAMPQGGQLVDRINNSLREAEAVAEQLNRLEEVHTAGEKTRTGLETITASAQRIQEALRAGTADADQRTKQLDSHNAAAGHVLHELAETNKESHSLIQQLKDSTAQAATSAGESVDQINRLIEDAWGLTSKTEACVRELSEKRSGTQQLLEKLDAATGSAQPIQAELARTLEHAELNLVAVTGRCDEAAKLAERLAGFTQSLTAAGQTEDSVRKATQEAREAHETLSDLTRTAAERHAALEKNNARACDAIETCGRLKTDAERVSERFAAQLQAMQKSIEVGEPMIEDFTSRTCEIDQLLGGLKVAVDELDQRVTKMLERPEEIAAGAQAQAGELEKVCSAVRKVFAGLSKATLEARQHAEDSRRADREATARLSQLTAESQCAIDTLHQWVAEASRAAARLDDTLKRTPSIRDTHPGEIPARASRGLSQRTTAAPLGGGEAALRLLGGVTPGKGNVDGQLTLLNDPQPIDHSAAPQDAVPSSGGPPKPTRTKPPTRAEEIAQLIEEAKRMATSS